MRPSFVTTVLMRRTVLTSTTASASKVEKFEVPSQRTEGFPSDSDTTTEAIPERIAHQQKQIEDLMLAAEVSARQIDQAWISAVVSDQENCRLVPIKSSPSRTHSDTSRRYERNIFYILGNCRYRNRAQTARTILESPCWSVRAQNLRC
jgi:hypothetical protein